MTTLELHRDSRHRQWSMQGAGVIRDHLRILSADAEFTLDDGRRFTARRQHYFRWQVCAHANDGSELGSYDQTRRLRAGGPLQFAEQHYELVPLRKNLVHLELRKNGTALAEAGADRKRTAIETTSPDKLDAGLLLFFAWISSQ